MEYTVQEMAEVLRSTEPMADQFAKRVQERLGRQVPYADILAVMKKSSAKTLSMDKVVSRLRQQRKRKS